MSAFVESHPAGWGHDEWLALLGDLEREGVSIDDPDALGMELEKSRLRWTLTQAGVAGLGPKRIDAITERYRTLWNLRHATAAEIAEIKTVPAKLAESVVEALGGID